MFAVTKSIFLKRLFLLLMFFPLATMVYPEEPSRDESVNVNKINGYGKGVSEKDVLSLTRKISSYVVKASDILNISVWGEPDLNKDVIVLPDYTISFPLMGVMSVLNKDIATITIDVQQGIEKYIPDANVHVSIQKIRGNKFYVLGKVNRPGEYPLEQNITVLQALSFAGGMSTFADVSDIKLIRDESGHQSSIKFDYQEMSAGENLEQNIYLQNGDVVLVP